MKNKFCDECFSELKKGKCKDCSAQKSGQKKPYVDYPFGDPKEIFKPELEGITWDRVKKKRQENNPF